LINRGRRNGRRISFAFAHLFCIKDAIWRGISAAQKRAFSAPFQIIAAAAKHGQTECFEMAEFRTRRSSLHLKITSEYGHVDGT
jgi:hypothetical protein